MSQKATVDTLLAAESDAPVTVRKVRDHVLVCRTKRGPGKGQCRYRKFNTATRLLAQITSGKHRGAPATEPFNPEGIARFHEIMEESVIERFTKSIGSGLPESNMTARYTGDVQLGTRVYYTSTTPDVASGAGSITAITVGSSWTKFTLRLDTGVTVQATRGEIMTLGEIMAELARNRKSIKIDLADGDGGLAEALERAKESNYARLGLTAPLMGAPDPAPGREDGV